MGHRDAGAFRGLFTKLASKILRTEVVHRKFEAFNGEAAIAALAKSMRLSYPPHPWDDFYQAAVVEHPLVDAFWDERDVTRRLAEVDIPVYLGCDWDNVPLHLPSTFWAWDALRRNPHVRLGMLPRGGLCWPWESFHVEALAFFDRWLKGKATGIDEGPPVRYWLHGAEEWREASEWPPAGVVFQDMFLRADGALAAEEGAAGSREYLHFPAAIERPPNANPATLPDHLVWETGPSETPLDIVGPLALELDARATAGDVDWIALLQDVAPDGETRDLTQGLLRASHRALDPARSRPGAPFYRHDHLEPVTPGEVTHYSVALVPTAHRIVPGHRLRLRLASQDRGHAMLGFEHAELSLPSRNTVLSSSRLMVPVLSR
jgi:putative CocE/NonD family hydrolase